MIAYVIVSNGRSRSTLLRYNLASTGVAGTPRTMVFGGRRLYRQSGTMKFIVFTKNVFKNEICHLCYRSNEKPFSL